MPRYSKNPKRTKPQGAIDMPVPIGANDERRGRNRDNLRAKTPELIVTGRMKPATRIARMEKKDPLV